MGGGIVILRPGDSGSMRFKRVRGSELRDEGRSDRRSDNNEFSRRDLLGLLGLNGIVVIYPEVGFWTLIIPDFFF